MHYHETLIAPKRCAIDAFARQKTSAHYPTRKPEKPACYHHITSRKGKTVLWTCKYGQGPLGRTDECEAASQIHMRKLTARDYKTPEFVQKTPLATISAPVLTNKHLSEELTFS